MWRVQIVAFDVKNSIPSCAIILERDLRPQLHELFFGELFSQMRIQIVRNIRGRISHAVSQFNDQAFGIIEWGPVVAEHSEQFVIVQACFSAHGRINIYSERTSDARSGSDFSQLNVTQRDNSFAAERGFHGDAAPDKSRQTHLDLCRRKIFPEHFAHHAVKPPQMPGCLIFFQSCDSGHPAPISFFTLPLRLAPTLASLARVATPVCCVMMTPMEKVGADGVIMRELMCDIDRTLLQENLKLTAEQRLAKFASFMRFIAELRRAGEDERRKAKR